MRKLILTVSALALAIPMATPASAAGSFGAQASSTSTTTHSTHRYHARSYRHYSRCRYSPGTTGLVAGGVGGALIGHDIFGHGLLGTVAGGVGGAFAGRAIDRSITARRRGCR